MIKINYKNIYLNKLKQELLYIDKKLYVNSKKNKYLIFKGYRNKKYKTVCGVINIKRRIYLDKTTNKYIYLLDQELKLDKYVHYDDQLINLIKKLVIHDHISYSAVQKYIDFKISKFSIFKIIKNKIQVCDHQDIKLKNISMYKNLYINIDDTFLATKQKSKILNRFRVVCAHQGIKNKQYINKTLFVFKINNSVNLERFYLKLKNKLNEYYKNVDQFNIFILGDGANWIKNLAKLFDAKYIIDKFHLFKKIRECFNFYAKNKTLKNTILNNKNKLNYMYYKKVVEHLKCLNIKSLEKIKNNLSYFMLKRFKKLFKYIKNSFDGIINLFNNSKNYKVCLTETYVQSLVKQIKGNIGRLYSLNTLKKIISVKSIVHFD